MNAIAKTQQLKTQLSQSQNQIKSLLGDKERAFRFMAASLIVGTDPALNQCSTDSIVNALVGVAQLDLNPDKNVGHAYLVPYKGSCQLQVGYKGFIQLLFRAGWLVKAYPVYQCDEFEISFDGWDNQVSFKPDIDSREDDDNNWVYNHLRGVYVIARNSETGDEYSDFVTKRLIEKTRLKSQNQKNPNKPEHIWFDWYAEMARKTAVKKLAKALPIGDTRTLTALTFDDKATIGQPVDYKQTAEQGVVIDQEPATEPSIDLNDIATAA